MEHVAHPKGYRTYFIVWLVLLGLTLGAFGVSHLDVSAGMKGFLLTATSMAKVLIIAAYFMHLRFERRNLVIITAAPLLLALILWYLVVPDTQDTARRTILRPPVAERQSSHRGSAGENAAAKGSAKQLTRAQAATLIQNSQHFKDNPKEWRFYLEEEKCSLYRSGHVALLKAAGWIDFEVRKDTGPFARTFPEDYCRPVFTDKGKEASKEWRSEIDGFNKTHWLLPIATMRVIEVTGVKQDGNNAAVDYTWQWTPTKFYQAAQSAWPEEAARLADLAYFDTRTRESRAILALYDDGWRVTNIILNVQ
jgi:caa(3)-type oxidase subunit IV